MWSPPSNPTKNPSPPFPKTTPLFPPSLLPPSPHLPANYTLRPLQLSDYASGILDVLRVLTTVGDVSQERWERRWRWMKGRNEVEDGYEDGNGDEDAGGQQGGEKEGEGERKRGSGEERGEYFIVVVEDEKGMVVGTGGLVVERKFIHNLGLVGHIEDIAVAKDQQGKKLGLRIIEALGGVAERVGCYKTILDCSEANEGFYVKCGYKRTGLEMAKYYEERK